MQSKGVAKEQKRCRVTDLSTAVARVLATHREQYPLVTGGLAPCVTCKTPYPCVVAEALEPARVILAGGPGLRLHGARCADCDRPMVAQTSDTVVCTCDDEPVPFTGQIGTGF